VQPSWTLGGEVVETELGKTRAVGSATFAGASGAVVGGDAGVVVVVVDVGGDAGGGVDGALVQPRVVLWAVATAWATAWRLVFGVLSA
jgi:hypothetical protein